MTRYHGLALPPLFAFLLCLVGCGDQAPNVEPKIKDKQPDVKRLSNKPGGDGGKAPKQGPAASEN
jgi:hypothetical protein